MKPYATAIKAARLAFRAGLQGKAVLGYPVNDPYGSPEWPRWWDEITNGWAAVRAGWSAFWSTLREWGGTDYRALASAAAANPHAARGLRLLADNGAAVPIIAYRAKRDASEGGEDEEAPDLPALRLIERTGWAAVWTPFVWGAHCGGEAFYRLDADVETGPNRVPRARAIVPLRNELLQEIVTDDDGAPVRYVFLKPKGRGTVSYIAAEVLHVRLYNPLDPDRGLPILVAARRALTLVEEADTWNRSIASGGGRVPGYLKPTNLPDGKTLSSETVKAAQEVSDRATMERRYRNLPQVLSGAFDYVDGSVSPKEADWLRGREQAMREIAAVLGVSATLLADQKAGSLTDAGVDSEIAALLKLTIQPLVTFLLGELTRWLCGEGERLAADWDQVPALAEDQDALWTRYGAAVRDDLISREEARAALGYDEETDDEDAGDADAEGVEGAEDAAVPELALNGAQVTSALEIVQQVATGMLPRESGVRMLTAFFNIAPALAEAIMGEVGRGFQPATPPSLPTPAFGGDGQEGELPALRYFRSLDGDGYKEVLKLVA